MKITSVKVLKNEASDARVRGYANVVIDEGFAIHDIRIIEGENGLFLAMPSKKNPDGTFRDVAHPINPEVRAIFEEAILTEYNKSE
ncbi:MAG: SpoVG family protein [Treponema sp.]|nr:SpoVG family protein [Clostridia bacterium]MBP3607024.1 SpoVG family protein [Treponema sp.]